MEKNHRFSNQNLPKGGQQQPTESKKSSNQDVSVKWPRHSKRREQPNAGGTKPDSYRNSSGKAGQSAKARNQTNFNYDKRSRQRPEVAPLDVAASALESAVDALEEQYDGTGLAAPRANGGHAVPVRHELHSVFSPGSKKQSLNHLLNFHYAPRDRDQPARLSKTGNNRCYMTKKFSYNKEQFLQANCQFVVRSGEDYEACLASPDQLVEWSKIEQIHILSAEEPKCPICLYPPVAAKMTKCGHVYCWPCILHYLALSDKSWRKCPICYDAIHVPDLRSAVSKPFHSYAIGEYVTFQLMRREKTSMALALASEDAADGPPTSTLYDPKIGNSILTKLLVADSVGINSIIDREQQELDNQIVVDGMDCPENIFVQQALEQVKERREKVASKKIAEPSSEPAAPIAEQVEPVTEAPEQPADFGQALQDILIDEDSNFLLSDIDIVQTLQCATSDCFYFYQATDGQPLYLHSMNTRMLQAMYGGLDKGPLKITGKIVQKDSCSMSEDLRKRLKYLQHLPVCTQFEVVEVELDPGTISAEVLAQFKDELNDRRKNRQKRARAERIREKQIFEFNERQLGKSMARSAKIQIDSNKHFPSCGSVESYDFSAEPTLGTSSGTDLSASPGTSAGAGPSWSKMLSTSSRWPSLGAASSTNAFGPLATPPAPKLLQVTGSNMSAVPSVERRRRSDSSDFEDNVDVDQELRAPEFRNDLSFAIEAALGSVSLGQSGGKGKKEAVSGGGGGAAGAGNKKKKNKKTLLFASGMNLN
ncbi:RING finger protein 10 [Culex quinquefasciatus]|uniref:E3 ubiquitin-protein ligase RNF10 n=1 Tax=Culex quinquefasciatus TaxID=7176 RepID=B0W2V1_CULQU|nr:RING finger protein 10 [Culex quinquefasciatus]EDS30310.1 RING finger protein 10 [Culex quinquefasciatus]|eukprot:XP_001843035.1 RING finger protein 10 [Culex quinquefasciatus]